MDDMASMILSYSWLKFTDILLFTMCLVIRIQIYNIDFFYLERSSPFAIYRSVLYMRRCFELIKDAGQSFVCGSININYSRQILL
jgi:hypothetical protein